MSADTLLEKYAVLLRKIAYPRRGTDDEQLDIYSAAALIQASFTAEDLGRSHSPVPEEMKALANWNFVYLGPDADASNPASLYCVVKNARALIAKAEAV